MSSSTTRRVRLTNSRRRSRSSSLFPLSAPHSASLTVNFARYSAFLSRRRERNRPRAVELFHRGRSTRLRSADCAKRPRIRSRHSLRRSSWRAKYRICRSMRACRGESRPRWTNSTRYVSTASSPSPTCLSNNTMDICRPPRPITPSSPLYPTSQPLNHSPRARTLTRP